MTRPINPVILRRGYPTAASRTKDCCERHSHCRSKRLALRLARFSTSSRRATTWRLLNNGGNCWTDRSNSRCDVCGQRIHKVVFCSVHVSSWHRMEMHLASETSAFCRVLWNRPRAEAFEGTGLLLSSINGIYPKSKVTTAQKFIHSDPRSDRLEALRSIQARRL